MLIHFFKLPHLNPREVKWSDYFTHFDSILHYVKGVANVVADALSHRLDLSLHPLCSPIPKSPFIDALMEAYSEF